MHKSTILLHRDQRSLISIVQQQHEREHSGYMQQNCSFLMYEAQCGGCFGGLVLLSNTDQCSELYAPIMACLERFLWDFKGARNRKIYKFNRLKMYFQ